MDTSKIRSQTQILVDSLGYPFNVNLPALDPVTISRKPDEISGRILALNACVACSYGFSRNSALGWLEQEGLGHHLSKYEHEYLHGKDDAKKAMLQWQVEALWSLTWAASYHNNLDFSRSCSKDFVFIFPDLKNLEPSVNFLTSYSIRSTNEIARMLDIAYCLHWAVREMQIQGKQQKLSRQVHDQVIIERRRGLEWLVGEEDWDDVSLDT